MDVFLILPKYKCFVLVNNVKFAVKLCQQDYPNNSIIFTDFQNKQKLATSQICYSKRQEEIQVSK